MKYIEGAGCNAQCKNIFSQNDERILLQFCATAARTVSRVGQFDFDRR